MTPAQQAAARTDMQQAARDLDADRHFHPQSYTEVGLDELDGLVDLIEKFRLHTEVLAGHLALALSDPPDSPSSEWEFKGTIEHGKLIGPDGVEVHPFDGLRARKPDPFDGLTGAEAVGADPTRNTTPEGPTP